MIQRERERAEEKKSNKDTQMRKRERFERKKI